MSNPNATDATSAGQCHDQIAMRIAFESWRDSSPGMTRLDPDHFAWMAWQAASQQARTWLELTDEDRAKALRSLPDMLDGFLKTWGWLHFAKAIEAECREKNSP